MKKQIKSHNQSYNRKLYVRMYYSWPFRIMVFGLIIASGVFGLAILEHARTSKAATTLSIYPPQPGAVIYNSDAPASYAKAGAMVDMNSAESAGAKAVSNAGGTVLVYVDTIADGSGGNYAGMINNANSCGPAIGRWPGANQFNSYGYVRDLKTLVNSGKLKCILDKVVSDNPHMGGFFADDLGTTNPQYSGSIATQNGGCSIPTDDFYNAVINTLKVFRQVADANGIMVMVNGTYQGGSCKGGYPDRTQHGTSLAEGSCIEHHSKDSFFSAYTSSAQWADASPITKGQSAHFAIVSPGDTSWNTDGNTAWITQQNSYGSAPNPWTTNFHSTGLPTKVSGTPTTTPPPTTPPPTLAKPAIPTGVKLTPGDHKLVVTWNASPSSEQVDNYQVYLNGSYAYTNVTSPTYTISGTPGQTYTLRVSAHNSAGYGDWTASYSGVIGSASTSTPPPTTTPPPTNTPPPPVSIPNANPSTPVSIPSNLPVQQGGTLIADFNGDGLNDVAKDINNDNKIDPKTEIVVDGKNDPALTDTSQSPISASQYDQMLNSTNPLSQNSSNDSITFKAGPLPEVKVSKKTAYNIIGYQAIGIAGIGGYWALAKFGIIATLRRRLFGQY